MSLNELTSLQITEVLSTSDLERFHRELTIREEECLFSGRMELIQIARKARALDMLISASKTTVSPHDLAVKNDLIRKAITELRLFTERRLGIRHNFGERSRMSLYDLMRVSEENFRRACREVIQQVICKARAHRLTMLSLSHELNEREKGQLVRIRIECDDAFAKAVDSSISSFQDIVQDNLRHLDSVNTKEVEDVRTICTKSIANHDKELERALDINATRISSMIDTMKANWESEDFQREDLEGQLRNIKAEITKARRVNERRRLTLKKTRIASSKEAAQLVEDIIQIQNRYARLVDKSRTLSEKADESYLRILKSDRAEMTEMLTQIWQSYKSLNTSTTVDETDIENLYVQLQESPDSTSNPFEDILEINSRIFDHVGRIYAQLSEEAASRSK